MHDCDTCPEDKKAGCPPERRDGFRTLEAMFAWGEAWPEGFELHMKEATVNAMTNVLEALLVSDSTAALLDGTTLVKAAQVLVLLGWYCGVHDVPPTPTTIPQAILDAFEQDGK